MMRMSVSDASYDVSADAASWRHWPLAQLHGQDARLSHPMWCLSPYRLTRRPPHPRSDLLTHPYQPVPSGQMMAMPHDHPAPQPAWRGLNACAQSVGQSGCAVCCLAWRHLQHACKSSAVCKVLTSDRCTYVLIDQLLL